MDKKIMKKHKVSLLGRVLGMMLLVAGVQGAFAGCLGTIHVKLPDTWTTSYVYFANTAYLIPATTPKNGAGYMTIDLGDVVSPQPNTSDNGFVFTNSKDVDYPPPKVVDNGEYNVSKGRNDFTKSLIKCPGDGAERYIFENPKVEGQTEVSVNPPDAKYIYFLVPPEDDDWMAAIPMVSLDGGQTAVRMQADPDRCGWFYYVWFGEPVSDNVVFMRDDAQDLEHAIGANGTIEEADQAQPIPLLTYYAAFNETNVLYYIPVPEMRLGGDDDIGFYDVDPGVEGSCSYTLAAIIYDTDAQLHPAFSCDYYTSEGQINEGCQVGVTALGVDGTTAQTRVKSCLGVTPGIVVDTLGADKKPHLNTSPTGNGVKCFGTAQLFDM